MKKSFTPSLPLVLKKIIFFFTIIIIFVFIALSIYLKPYALFFKKVVGVSPLTFLFANELTKQNNGRVTIVLLGRAGEGYEGTNLTDSITVASYHFKNQKLHLISVPRDIWSDSLKDKINSAYAYGEAQQKGSGLTFAKKEIGKIVAEPIHYALVIDFDKFKELIDYLGGVDIVVDRSFVDSKFPIKGKENDPCDGDPQYQCRWQQISFQKGPQHMDGETALKFIRSRNASGEEGNDFARNQREKKMINALIKELTETIKKTDLKQWQSIYQLLDKTIERDISNKELAFLGKNILFFPGLRNIKVNSIQLGEDFFIVPPYNQYFGKYVLIPKSGDFKIVHQYISCLLNNDDASFCTSQNERKDDES